jgi:hypothetical protein
MLRNAQTYVINIFNNHSSQIKHFFLHKQLNVSSLERQDETIELLSKTPLLWQRVTIKHTLMTL